MIRRNRCWSCVPLANSDLLLSACLSSWSNPLTVWPLTGKKMHHRSTPPNPPALLLKRTVRWANNLVGHNSPLNQGFIAYGVRWFFCSNITKNKIKLGLLKQARSLLHARASVQFLICWAAVGATTRCMRWCDISIFFMKMMHLPDNSENKHSWGILLKRKH